MTLKAHSTYSTIKDIAKECNYSMHCAGSFTLLKDVTKLFQEDKSNLSKDEIFLITHTLKHWEII